MTPYADAACAILAFMERCVDRQAARTAAIRSVAAHRSLDASILARVVSRKEKRDARDLHPRDRRAAVRGIHRGVSAGVAGVGMNFPAL